MPREHQFGYRSGEGDYTGSTFGTDAIVIAKNDIKFSAVTGFAKLIGNNRLTNCSVVGNSVLCDTESEGGHFVDTVSHYNIVKKSLLEYNTIVWSRIENCYLKHSIIDNCVLQDVTGKDVQLKNCQVKDCVLPLNCIIEEGIWTRPPLTFTCKSGFVVCEGIEDKVIVSCTNNKIDKWLSGAGRRYGRTLGLKEEEIDEIENYVRIIRDSKKESQG